MKDTAKELPGFSDVPRTENRCEQPLDFTLNQSSLMIRAPCALLLRGCIGIGIASLGGALEDMDISYPLCFLHVCVEERSIQEPETRGLSGVQRQEMRISILSLIA